MKDKYDFNFYFDTKVKTTSDINEALKIFRCGGFYKAICYFPLQSFDCFRVLEKESDFEF